MGDDVAVMSHEGLLQLCWSLFGEFSEAHGVSSGSTLSRAGILTDKDGHERRATEIQRQIYAVGLHYHHFLENVLLEIAANERKSNVARKSN